jgi:hypothetical protein
MDWKGWEDRKMVRMGGMCGRWFRKQVVASFCSTIVQYSKVTGELVSNISMNGGGKEGGDRRKGRIGERKGL